MRADARLLPVIRWAGREFLVDVGARLFRDINDAGDFIDMHSPQGREMVRQMQGAEWRVFAVAAIYLNICPRDALSEFFDKVERQ